MEKRLVLLLALIAVAATVQANFAAAPGFSGRVADCGSCHRPPVEGDNAVVAIDGLPEAWNLNTTYEWTITISGGPNTVPGGPQGGFEVEVLAGRLTPGAEAGDDVRNFHPRQATYTESGVYQKEWSVAWSPPDLATRPAAVTVWVAGVAANGNHNVQLNTSDLGEHGDSVDARSYVIPPSEATMAAWRALPLAVPVIDTVRASDGGHIVEGRMPDGNTTHIDVFDGQQWLQRPVASAWRVVVAGVDTVQLRASGDGRFSPEIIVDLESGNAELADDVTPAPKATPAPFAILPLALAALLRRHL